MTKEIISKKFFSQAMIFVSGFTLCLGICMLADPAVTTAPGATAVGVSALCAVIGSLSTRLCSADKRRGKRND